MIDCYTSTLKLMRLLEAGHSPDELLGAAGSEHDSAHVLMRMSMLFHIFGKFAEALELQAEALRLRRQYQLRADRAPTTLHLLVIVTSGYMLENTPVEFLIEDSDIACTLLYVIPDAPLPSALPAHDVVFLAIGQFEQHRPLFARVLPLLRKAAGPVLNLPGPAFGFERDRVNALLQGIPGLVVPPTRNLSRHELERMAAGEAAGAAFPLIVRPLRSQAGVGLARLLCAEDIGSYLEVQAEPAFYLAPYVDYRSADGMYRKCRLLLLRGPPLVCHYAISSHWVVHYQSAGMADSASKRDEEANFIADAEQGFCRRHGAALAQVAARIGLDYVVLDCGETPDGRLLFFEADNVSVVHAVDPAVVFPYKQAHMATVFQAFHDLLRGGARA